MRAPEVTVRAVSLAILAAVFLVACHPPDPPIPITADPGQLATLTISADQPLTGYSRAQFGDGWTTQPDGCDTRVDILKAQGQNVVTHGCTVVSGTWLSLYDGITITNPRQLDIDHLVPLAEAWKTGARSWTAARRTQFANDLTELVAVTVHSNRSKGDEAPPGYEPVVGERCDYAARWVSIKAKYGLTITQSERDALASMLATCGKGQ